MIVAEVFITITREEAVAVTTTSTVEAEVACDTIAVVDFRILCKWDSPLEEAKVTSLLAIKIKACNSKISINRSSHHRAVEIIRQNFVNISNKVCVPIVRNAHLLMAIKNLNKNKQTQLHQMKLTLNIKDSLADINSLRTISSI